MEIRKPTISDFTNATHSHTSNATGGIISPGRAVEILTKQPI